MVRIDMSDTLPYILLFWLIARAVANKTANIIRKQDVFVNHGLRNVTTASILQCCAVCMLDDNCKSGSYNDANKICQANDRNPFIDETVTKTSIDGWTSFFIAEGCRNGWTSYRGACYHVVTLFKTWTQSESNCRALGGHLADIQDAEENRFVRDLGRNTTNYTVYWIGLNNCNGTFAWSSAAPKPFRPNFTIYGGAGECLCVVTVIQADEWRAFGCAMDGPSICKAYF